MRSTVSLSLLAELKTQGKPIVMVTAYDYATARVADRAGVDMVLVGDSAAQVVLGRRSTVDITVDEMLILAAAARRGVESAFLVGDLPFGSTEMSDGQAVATATRFVKEAGVDAVKLEGGWPERLSRIRAIVGAGIPVIGHVGLTPQTAVALGGMRAQGRSPEAAARLAREAIAVQAAGASALVIEAVPRAVVDVLLPAMCIPVIGIGAGAADGQVLVMHDLLGITEGVMPRFVKTYAEVGTAMVRGVEAYAADVRSGTFPQKENDYSASAGAVAAAHDVLAVQLLPGRA
ncbi:3-methyl-2-oxobutanoate hydroxymethyltransferase [Microbacterium mangrovi]|uniref:3-methyl-2-oxobutanoate hydroxymethyltransferase n=1 Tax=Microbacterium mangrovi TaxID=1348253 RepID=A0A0B2A5Q6_9MICO|nr:3-methyl-2-oxobutanoate hydroxymethyltransferase [Microbacterium mangrovi]KHK98804.1 3-methyl-2-oxobutanoate hydroxymethyltransferase [Microbacterium mangrovi]